MTVKDLITKLLDYDMDAKLEILTNVEDDKIRSYSIVGVKEEEVYRTDDNCFHVYLYTFSGKEMKNFYKEGIDIKVDIK